MSLSEKTPEASRLLNEFFNHKSDASLLEASQQERLEKDFADYLNDKAPIPHQTVK